PARSASRRRAPLSWVLAWLAWVWPSARRALDQLVAEATALDLGLDLHVDLLVMSRCGWGSSAAAAAAGRKDRTTAKLGLDLHGISPCVRWMVDDRACVHAHAGVQ